MNLKKAIYAVVLPAAIAVSCTKNFEQINVNPTTLSSLSNSTLLTQSELNVSGGEYEAWRGNFIYTTLFVQQFASTAWNQGDKYFFDEGYSAALWDSYYGNAIKGLVNLVNKTTGSAADVNYNSAARVLKAFAFQRLTDLYGDIPYSEAGQGYLTGNFAPKYDTQQAIYNDLLKELDESAKAFDASKPFNGDIAYNGDVNLWKKATYSLMLRVAMRLSKVDENTAKTWAAKAVAGGVINDYTQAFKIAHLAGSYDNPNSHVLGYYNGARNELKNGNFKFSKTFIDALKSTNDPRLKILSVVRSANGTEDNDPAIQKGLPNGTDATTQVGSLESYSQLRSDFSTATAPNILVSESQTLLLMAEATERGWITGFGTGEELYRKGVKSAINQWKLYGASASLFDDAAINNFAATVPYGASLTEKLAAINNQYWIASLLDGYESFANYRRSGYPVLTAVNYAGNVTGGTIPRRLQYPASETGLNGANLNAAIQRLGGGDNNFKSRVWWDK